LIKDSGEPTITHRFHRDRFTWLAYLLLAFYGYFLNILGPVTPFLKEELRLSYTVSSLHFTAFAVGILVVGLGGHHLIRRAGRWRSLWIGTAGMSLGALLLLAGRSPVMTIGAAFFMGLVGSLILAAVPSALSDRHGELRAVALSEANVVASLVSATAPLMVGWFVRLTGDWRLALGIAAFTPLLMYGAFWKASPPLVDADQEVRGRARRPLPGLYLVFWLALVLVVAVEFCMIFWSADYLEHGLGLPKVEAAQAVSLFLAGMILGRLAGSRLVQRFSTHKLITAALLLASAGFLLYWSAGSVLLGVSGLFLTGLGVASLYPLTLSLAIGAAPDYMDQASARATLASGVAILALPLVLGRLADAVGIRLAYGVVSLLLASAFLIVQLTARFYPARHPVAET
jgi:fucose permease